jgi:uncharacterized protein (UPF0276 family)
VAAVAAAAAVEAAVAELPFLGAGVSLRPEWRWNVIRERERLDAVEVIPEDLCGIYALREIEAMNAAVSVLLHGIGLSLGGAQPLDSLRLAHWARLVEALAPPWISEHLAFTRAGGRDIGHLMPLPFTREAVHVVAANVRRLRAAVGEVPILLENIAYTIALPGEMTEAAFVRDVLDATGAGLLLDLENVHANSANHGYDPVAYLEQLPLDRVVEVHLAGGLQDGDVYADTHSAPVPEASWDLLRWLAERAPIRAVIVERDDDLPPFTELLDEIARARSILDDARRAAAVAGR